MPSLDPPHPTPHPHTRWSTSFPTYEGVQAVSVALATQGVRRGVAAATPCSTAAGHSRDHDRSSPGVGGSSRNQSRGAGRCVRDSGEGSSDGSSPGRAEEGRCSSLEHEIVNVRMNHSVIVAAPWSQVVYIGRLLAEQREGGERSVSGRRQGRASDQTMKNTS